jgi:predicted DCC family thiol-disulfide oxidoreductase YuxK
VIPLPTPHAAYLVFYDGNCGFCSRSIRILHSLDHKDRIHFAPLGGETATLHGVASDFNADTAIVIRLSDHRKFEKSAAALQCLRALGGIPSCVASLLSFIPGRLRDRFYDLIARHRHRLFSPDHICDIPDSRLQKKLLP